MSAKDITAFLSEILVTSGVIWAATMALKTGLRKQLSPRAHLAVWIVLVIRLVLPVTIDTGVHLIKVPSTQAWTASANTGTDESMKAEALPRARYTDAAPQPSVSAKQNYTGSVSTASGESVPQRNTSSLSFDADPSELAAAVWILGMLTGTALSLAGYERLRSDVKRRLVPGTDPLHKLFQECLMEAGIRKRVALAVQNELAGPALMYPNIVLVPDNMRGMDPEQARMALRHELTHFRRGDHFRSVGLCILRIIWWFNPFVWLAVRTIREDIETACDSDVVRPLGKAGKTEYAKAVLSMFGRTETSQAVLGMAFGGTKKNAEKRIRGIYMKKKSSIRGRTAAVCLAGILSVACLTTACQPTPEQEAVVNQKEGIPQSALTGESQTVDPQAKAAPAAQYSVEEHWQETIDKAKNFKVTADVDVMVPDVSEYPVEKIAPREITQELADQLINYFAPDADFYRTSQQRTKAEWEEMIMSMRETLAEDQARGDDDAVTQGQATIDEWTRLYEQAPEKAERSDADTEFTYMYDYYDGSLMEEFGPNYIAISADCPDGSIKQFDVRRKDDSDPSQWPYFMYTNADYQTESSDLQNRIQLDTSKRSVEELEEPLRSEEMERINKLDSEVNRRLALYDQNPMDADDTSARAAQILEDLGIYGTQITSCDKAVIGPYTGSMDSDLSDGSAPDLSAPGMYLTFGRENGGIPCMEPESQFLNPAEADNVYSAPFRPETGSMLLDADGTVRMFIWESPSQAVEIVSSSSELVPLDEAKSRLIEELYRREVDVSEEYLQDHPMEYMVESMELVMGYVDDDADPQDALAVPAWRMTAQGKGKSAQGDPIVLNNQELMISALDGRPILMAGTRQ